MTVVVAAVVAIACGGCARWLGSRVMAMTRLSGGDWSDAKLFYLRNDKCWEDLDEMTKLHEICDE